MLKICVDIDNVIAESDSRMRDIIRRMTGGRVNYSYEHIVEFDYDLCKDASGSSLCRNEWAAVHSDFSRAENILSLKPIVGACDALKLLSSTFEIHLATTRLAQARVATLQWLENNGFPPYDIHFLRHGQKHASLAGFSIAVEDHYEQAMSFACGGVVCYLLSHPWNRNKAPGRNVVWVDDWSELRHRLLACC